MIIFLIVLKGLFGKVHFRVTKITSNSVWVSKKSINQSKKLFELICKKSIITSILEAELVKLFSNVEVYKFFNIKSILYNFGKI